MSRDRISRRELLRAGAGLTAGAALATPGLAYAERLARHAAQIRPHGSGLEAIEHFVFLIMENRSYDHFFGAYSRGRGFNDHPAGQNGVFAQPFPNNPTLDPPNVLLPFYMGPNLQCTEDQSHSWGPTHSAFDGGKMDGWAKALPPRTMGFYERGDLPLQWALADLFTLCDGYHCSVMGPTHPNRLMAMCGSIDPAGTHGGPVTATNSSPDWNGRLTMETMPEVLEDAGVSWSMYNPSDVDMPAQYAALAALPGWNPVLYQPTGNQYSLGVGDNILPYFKPFLSPATTLYQKAFLPTFPGQFFRDCQSGSLPSVSWIAPPVGFDEHPDASPRNAEWFMQVVIDALTSNPAVWAKTALFITFDEHGGFFDHVAPPVAPGGTAGEYITAPNPSPNGQLNQWQKPTDPIGLGIRVPMTVVSPFSRGGRTVSEVFDHTSMLKLIETRFGVSISNISAWRRQTVGDLTATLTGTPDSATPTLPPTAIYMPLTGDCAETNQDTDSGGAAPGPPQKQVMPTQNASASPASTVTPTLNVTVEPGGHNGPVELLVHAHHGSFTGLKFALYHGSRLVSTAHIAKLQATPRRVYLHHKRGATLHPGRWTVVVHQGNTKVYEHTFALAASRL